MAEFDSHHDDNRLASHRFDAMFPGYGRQTWNSVIADADLSHAPRKRARLDDFGLESTYSTPVLKTLSHDAYTVGWVAALPIEMAAAQAMLDDMHQSLPMNPNDTNVYAFGNIGNHNIVIACLPSGQYGITSAALVANNMRWSFPSIKIRLMVGIGGGVPDKVDIRLGDVVVSNPTASSSGVIQYDFGKTVKAGRFQLSGTLNKPPQQLLTAVAKLRADHQLGPSQVSEHLATIRERNPSMDAYMYQEAGQDRLYEPTYDHVGDSCDECDPSQLVRREPRPNNCPKIHYGIIASANQVMKHGQTRQRLAHELNVLCFEMEAAGLMDSFPCLIIRGVCDYSDSHKAKQWQEYAAATAAAYAKELVSIIPSEEIHQNSKADINAPSREISLREYRAGLIDSLKFEDIDSRHSTIKSAHAKTCQWLLKHPDYIRWLNVSEFIKHHGILWIRGKPGAGKSTIMKYAFFRAGKTADNAAVISFFFNARGGSLERSTEGMHRSLLLQLLEKIPELQEVLEDANPGGLSRSGSHTWSLSKLRDVFARAVAKLGQRQVTCFIDALDECDESEVRQMLDLFEDLGQNAVQNNIRFYVCFSSRHYPYVDVQYGVQFTLEDQQGHETDLEDYVRSKMKTATKTQADEVINEIIRKASGVFMWVVLVTDILNKEFQRGRMFAVKKRLEAIPPELGDLFRDIMTRDNDNMDDLLLSIQWILFAKRPLRLEEYYFALVAGLEPDSLAEWDPTQISRESMNHFMVSSSKGLAEMTKTKIASVQFIHESVRDFLLKDKGLASLWPELGDNPEGRSHERLKICCHSYTQVDVSSCLPEDTGEGPKSRITHIAEKFPFLDYATNHVLYHSDIAESVGISQKSFIQNFTTSLDDWIKLNNLLEKFKVRRYSPGRASSLYVFADLGYAHIAEVVLREFNHPFIHSSPTQRHKTPLHAAVYLGHTNTVKAFLRHMTVQEINKLPLRKSQTLLSTAVEKKHAGIVEMLLEAGADPNFKGRSAEVDLLSRAIGSNSQDIVALLLSRTFSVQKPRALDSPVYAAVAETGAIGDERVRLEISLDACSPDVLYKACLKRQLTTARLLVSNGASVDGDVERFSKLLYEAVDDADEVWLELLIDSGFDINFIPKGRISLLHEALNNPDTSYARLLIEGGANISITPKGYSSQLIEALKNSARSSVKLSTESSANNSFIPEGYGFSLQEAMEHNDSSYAELLIKSGADVNFILRGLSSVLHEAVKSSNEFWVNFFIRHGADVNINAPTLRTPLYFAVNAGDESMVKCLLENGGNPDHSHDAYTGRTLLHLTISLENEPLMLLLLERGAMVDPSGCDISPLQLALRIGSTSIVRLLLQNGANIHITDNQGRATLHVAAQQGDVELIEMILNAGASIDCVDFTGNTPLLLACERQNYALAAWLFNRGARFRENDAINNKSSYTEGMHKHVDRLLQLGADCINRRDKFGRTPLFEACRLGAPDMVKYLLERGADAKITDYQDQNALFAISRSHAHNGRLTTLLVEAGADPMHKNTAGQTFLDAGLFLSLFPKLRERDMEHIFKRVRCGHLNKRGNFNRTLLGDAAACNSVSRVEFLLFLGADPNKTCVDGNTPLCEVARAGRSKNMEDIASLLLEAGADITIPNRDCMTPLDIAIRTKKHSLEKILRSRLDRTTPGQTPVSQVVEYNI